MTTLPRPAVRDARTVLRTLRRRRITSLALAGLLAACSGSEPETASATPPRGAALVAASPVPSAIENPGALDGVLAGSRSEAADVAAGSGAAVEAAATSAVAEMAETEKTSKVAARAVGASVTPSRSRRSRPETEIPAVRRAPAREVPLRAAADAERTAEPVELPPVAAARGSEAGTSHSASRKFVRGLAGVGLGVLEVPSNVVAETRSEGLLSGMTVGLAKGILRLVPRHLAGAYDLLTAPIPVPAGYAPILEPEFAWDLMRADGEPVEVEMARAIEFEPSATALPIPLRGDVAQLGTLLSTRSDVRIVLRGHADPSGARAANQRISRARALATMHELQAGGVPAQRIEIQALGASEALPEDGTRSNRRVEIWLYPADEA